MKKSRFVFLSVLVLFILSCQDEKKEKHLPYFGVHDIIEGDTVYYTVPKFHFINQDSMRITHHDVEGKVYIADFFFTTCPSICPAKTRQLSRIQDSLRVHHLLGTQVKIISHTVDPDHDTPAVLKQYAQNHGIDTRNWYLVTEEKEYLYRMAKQGYMATAFADADAEGGFFHTDQFVLLDGERHIRGFYDGTDTDQVNQLWEDILELLKEQKALKP